MAKKSTDKSRRLIESGADIAGASVGGALGFLAAGPAGAAAAGALGVAVARVLSEVAERTMTQAEKRRVGSVGAFAVEVIRRRLAEGDRPRADSFFDRTGVREPQAVQLFEGVLVKARDEYEEKKLKYLGQFFANLCFAEGVSGSMASQLLKIMERLTYRQLCIVALVGQRGLFDFEALRKPIHTDPELASLTREEMDLHHTDLGSIGLIAGNGPWKDELSTLGRVFYSLAGLSAMPDDEMLEVRQLLDRCNGMFKDSKVV